MRRALDAAGDLGERIRAGERAERVFGTADLHNRVRVTQVYVGDGRVVGRIAMHHARGPLR